MKVIKHLTHLPDIIKRIFRLRTKALSNPLSQKNRKRGSSIEKKGKKGDQNQAQKWSL